MVGADKLECAMWVWELGRHGGVVSNLDLHLSWICSLSSRMCCAGVTLWYLHLGDCAVVNICLIAVSTVR
jgi:hypothetical protein